MFREDQLPQQSFGACSGFILVAACGFRDCLVLRPLSGRLQTTQLPV
ncbi:MAG: hypothetical protein HYS07_01030 [Chlamydiae bacterium]|nr:hypothetical protein [Chlamydiota bacterium]MBI3276503.1 hypothetical protein [Chlamydiota bacterium]